MLTLVKPTSKSSKNPVSKNGRKTVKDDAPFKLDPAFIAGFAGKKPKFGYNGLGEFVFYRTYSRIKEDGTKETFADMVQRVVEGCYEIQRVWCSTEKNKNGIAFGGMALPWTRSKAQKSAQEMFQRMWDFKFLPPGRGLWVMGTPHMWKLGSSSLNNCGYCSTKDIVDDPAWPFAFVMDMSMLGVGVGFDTRGADKITVIKPNDIDTPFVIDDSRESWVDSLRCLIESFTTAPELGTVHFDYSSIRPAGAPIKGFGGKASGPDTLRDLHRMVRGHFHNILRRKSQLITSVDIVDFMNFIGRCVVAGNVRRSSEIALGDPADWDYMQMKDKKLFSEQLSSHRWASNNSIFAKVGMNYQQVAAQIADNGEPGCLWLDNVQNYGRTIDGRQEGIDKRAIGTNPCFAGSMRLLTAEGYKTISELWEAGGRQEYDGSPSVEKHGQLTIITRNGTVPATNIYRTGKQELYRVVLSTCAVIDATATHSFIVFNGDERRVKLSDLKVGDSLPRFPLFGLEKTQDYAVIQSINKLDEQDTFCLTEPANSEIVVNGICVGNCAEQSLEDAELCVSADTRVQTKDGCYKIVDLVGKKVEVWNGDRWSTVTPRITSKSRELYRVHLSDGSYLDCTANHGWQIQPPRSRHYRRVDTADLQPGQRSVPFELGDIDGISESYAFEYGLFVGDGYIDQKRPQVCICGTKAKLQNLGVVGKWWKPQIRKRYKDPYNRLNLKGFLDLVIAQQLNNKKIGLPDIVFSWDRRSILQFVAGWIETDGNLAMQQGSDAYRIFSTVEKIRDLQILLRRIGINHASIYCVGEVGDKIEQFGTVRNRAVWCCRIPSYECAEIPTRIKKAVNIGIRFRTNPFYGEEAEKIDAARRQNIVQIEKLPGLYTTYCFDEPQNHMGVFGNALTYQCCLCETFPAHHDDVADYHRTLKFAYLYAKTVTLIPTHCKKTNAVLLRNRRIGLSQSGIIQAFAKFGRRQVLDDFCSKGYDVIRHWDNIYSEWLCVSKSLKVSSVKPSGSVSLLAGSTAGIHFTIAPSRSYWRNVRVSSDSVLIDAVVEAGYHVEKCITDDKTSIVRFGVSEPEIPSICEISIWQQMKNAVDMQRYWADNQVSCTIQFRPEEAKDIPYCLEAFDDELKGISFLPYMDHGYPQAPYQPATPEEVKAYNAKLKPLNFDKYFMEDAIGTKFCDGDNCQV